MVARWGRYAEDHPAGRNSLVYAPQQTHTHSCQKEGCFSLLGRVFLQNDFLYLLDFICSAKKKNNRGNQS